MTVSVLLSPIAIVVVASMEIAVTGIGAAGAFTVMAQVPVLELSRLDVAVIVAVPCATAVTKPVWLTVATLASLVDQVTVLSAVEGVTFTVAVNCCVSLISKVAEAGETVTLETVGVTGAASPSIK